MSHQAATESAQESELTAVADWFELDVVRDATTGSAREEVVEAMNKAVKQPDNAIEVSWWDIDGWAAAVDKSSEKACEIIARLSEEAQN